MAFSWRFVILLLLLVIFEISFGVRRYLNETEVVRAVQMLEGAASQRTVAERLGAKRSVVARLCIRLQETGRYRRPRQGCGRDTTARQDRYLQNMTCNNLRFTPRNLQNDFQQATNVRVSDQTVRNRLYEYCLRSRIPARCPQRTAPHLRALLEFAQEHQHWQLRHQRTVLFTELDSGLPATRGGIPFLSTRTHAYPGVNMTLTLVTKIT